VDYYNEDIGMSLDDFVQKNKNMAFSIANRYRKSCENSMDDLEDYEQICFVGLIKAYKRYKVVESKGKIVKPSTFAYNMIKSELTTYIRDKGYVVRYPREFYSVWARFSYSDLDINEDPQVIADTIGMDVKYVKDAMKYYGFEQPLSMQAPFKIGNDEDDENDLEGHIARYSDFSMIYVNDFIDSLEGPEKSILKLTLQDKSQTDIAKVVGYSSVSSVSRTLKRIKEKLKNYYLEAVL